MLCIFFIYTTFLYMRLHTEAPQKPRGRRRRLIWQINIFLEDFVPDCRIIPDFRLQISDVRFIPDFRFFV